MTASPMWGLPGQLIGVELLLWSVLWMVAGILALSRQPAKLVAAFWTMSGICAAVEALVSIAALLVSPPEPWLLRHLLVLGAGVAVVLAAVGLVFCLRRRRYLRGYGAAIIVQAGFVLFLALTNAYFLPSQ